MAAVLRGCKRPRGEKAREEWNEIYVPVTNGLCAGIITWAVCTADNHQTQTRTHAFMTGAFTMHPQGQGVATGSAKGSIGVPRE